MSDFVENRSIFVTDRQTPLLFFANSNRIPHLTVNILTLTLTSNYYGVVSFRKIIGIIWLNEAANAVFYHTTKK